MGELAQWGYCHVYDAEPTVGGCRFRPYRSKRSDKFLLRTVENLRGPQSIARVISAGETSPNRLAKKR